ncbi:HpcH/HpaI aldolase/citrate lyase family protein [Deinococcus lacus]|uniref:HpcH/HpaI aldolase/citrate lyase family protein n=1 Tax=Deinococcus lacus TaxID=392561 RepID=A0ABW1YHU7_9DEIO
MTHLRPRSVLFAPANQVALLQKLPRSGPDIAAVDLEDAVPQGAKGAARQEAHQAAEWFRAQVPQQAVYLRINAVSSPHFLQDLDVLEAGWDGVILPKVESAGDLARLSAELARRGLDGLPVMAGLETVAGVEGVGEILGGAHPPASVYFGAEDYVADLGGQRTPEGLEVLYPRSRVAAQARLRGIPALDIVCTSFKDSAAFTREAKLGRALGYAGKLCIHPAQVADAHRVFSPSPQEVRRAQALLDAYAAAQARGAGVLSFEGQMVDAPMLILARATLQAAGREAATEPVEAT